MFSLAIVIGNDGEASAKFRHWLRVADPAGVLCPHVAEFRYPWGWVGVGVAGSGFFVLKRGPNQACLIAHGVILNSDIQKDLKSADRWESAAAKLPETTGQFVFASLCNNPERPVIAGSDNLAMRPMFWSERDGIWSIANHSALCGLMVNRLEQDPEYIRDLTTKDAVRPWLSLVRKVRRVPRGSYLTWESGAVRTVATRFRDLHTWEVGRATAVESLRQATQSLGAYQQPLLLGLSGGVDARLTMALLMAEKIPFESATHNLPCVDGDIAQELAACAGVPFWPIKRSSAGPVQALTKYFAMVPWMEGTAGMGSLSLPFTAHDFLAARGMIHLGGLGGETARAYWDMASARFASPEELIDARFFEPIYDGLYPTPAIRAETQRDWYVLAQVEGAVDRFASTQVAYHDARLRGTLGLRGNGAWFDYAWLLSNPEFYAYAWRLPRAQRQAGAIFDDFIGECSPALLKVRWLRGTSGTYIKGGLKGQYHKIKAWIKRWPIVHHLRDRLPSRRKVNQRS